MRAIRVSACLAVLAVAPAALAACGSSDNGDNGSSQDEDQITATITKAATSGDPTVCTTLQTANFTKQTSGSVESCKKDAANTAANTADVTSVDVNGSSATATASFTGSILDGQSLDLTLVKEGGTWKLDSVKGFSSFDRDKLIAAFDNQFANSPDSPPAQIVSCLKQQLQKASDEQLQSLILTQNGGDQLFSACAGGQ